MAPSYNSALVTGASSGLGSAIARSLLDDGLTVYGTTRDPEKSGLESRVEWLAFDGSSAAGITAFINEHEEVLESVDILINNAGGAVYGDLATRTPETLVEEMELLYHAPVALTRVALRAMRSRGTGAIVNVSSLAALFPLPYLSGYSAAKAALSGFTRSLLLSEKGRSRVQLIDFQPGDLRTGFHQNMAVPEELNLREKSVLERLEANLEASPSADRSADQLVRAIHNGRSGTIRSGGFFQAVIAPMGFRILPASLLLSAIRRYYGLTQR